jgi:hypothetical protein
MPAPRISIRIPPRIQEDIAALADATGRSESEVVREALEDYCRQHATAPTCYDVARKAGVIGAARKLPSDLSTGARHMQGFGRE